MQHLFERPLAPLQFTLLKVKQEDNPSDEQQRLKDLTVKSQLYYVHYNLK